MTWVRYDDNVRDHPKVRDLDDATYRLWREAIEWSSSSQTDGVIRREDLGLTSRRANPVRAAKLVDAQLWHRTSNVCSHPKCPPPGPDGWVIHDYWDYNPTAAQVREEQARARERKRKWMEGRKNGGKNGVPNDVPNGEKNAVPNGGKNGNPAPPRPLKAGRDEVPPAPPAASGVGPPAGGEDQTPKPVAAQRPEWLQPVTEAEFQQAAAFADDMEREKRELATVAAQQRIDVAKRGAAMARAALRGGPNAAYEQAAPPLAEATASDPRPPPAA